MLETLGVLGALILGLFGGSAVATVAARLPLGAPVWGPPVCVRRGVRLPWADALPLVGYLRRGGRCRVCGEHLPRWWPLTEAALALGALLAYFAAGGWNAVFALYVADLAVLLLILLMDWRRHEIYTVVLLAGAASGHPRRFCARAGDAAGHGGPRCGGGGRLHAGPVWRGPVAGSPALRGA